MATFVAVLCLLAVLVSIPLVVLKPEWVFYIFLAAAIYGNLLAGYIREAGNLGASRVWQPVDMLVFLLLFAALVMPSSRGFPSNTIKKCLVIVAILGSFSLALGLLLYFHDALKASRDVHFIAVMLFAVRYFTDQHRVERFLRVIIILITIMFITQILIRFGIYAPSSAESQAAGQLAGERGEASLTPALYLLLVSIAVARFSLRVRPYATSILLLSMGFIGVALSETRTYYGGVAVIATAALLMMRGRIKTILIYGLGTVLVLTFANKVGFDILDRFRVETSHEIVINPVGALDDVRRAEYSAIVTSYRKDTLLLPVGRGVGAMHYLPHEFKAAGFTVLERYYYHSEYLGWLDKFGAIGLLTLLVMYAACLVRSFLLARSSVPYLTYYGTMAFLLVASLVASGIFVPIFLHSRAGPVFICFVAIIANWQIIEQGLYEQRIGLEEEI